VLPIEFLVLSRPMSLQTNSRVRFQSWKSQVRAEAAKAWGGRPILSEGEFHLTIVHLHHDVSTPDVDNIIKPIQDALEGVVLFNDNLVSDVESHRRMAGGRFEPARLPELLVDALDSSLDCVYVRLADAAKLEDLL
jgi:Holliday junction resolvase RusA-like endonuclease